MVLTESNFMDLGVLAPDFNLKSSTGQWLSLDDVHQNKPLVVIFICNHCPYVIHIAPALALLANKYQALGVNFVAINSNDTLAYPSDGFEFMELEREKRGYTFPYLFDETQSVAKAYEAACTPDLYVFGVDKRLIYRGQFDQTRPQRISSGNYDSQEEPATGASLASVLDDILSESLITIKSYPSIGCNIKWRL